MRPVVLCDLDGTLANTVDLIVASFQHAWREVLGAELDAATARTWIGRPLVPVFTEVAPDHAEALDLSFRTWNLAHHDSWVAPYPGVSELIADLRRTDRPLGVATSKRRETALRSLQVVGLDVAVLAAMEDTTDHKPHPAPLLFAARALGVRPEECVYVGDSPFDIQAAHAAGMPAIAVTWGASEQAELTAERPAAVATDVSELAELLR